MKKRAISVNDMRSLADKPLILTFASAAAKDNYSVTGTCCFYSLCKLVQKVIC